MTIDAKIIGDDQKVRTIQINDDPTELELITILGGDEDNRLAVYGVVNDWDIIYIPGSKEKMVLGASPYMSQRPIVRVTCNLPDDEVIQLIKTFDTFWLGRPPKV
ncbi:hypothetical protein [Rhizobium sp. L245/93]|uniref:hypothetical protein n=1 Tax=Rhizobium sp. L245/93 TaxID=2819998 RepID=UPI001ADCAE2D|nr:hypothetical protein [Rhizobium sp. L245/93]MBO9170888.1 hypothetical protein [Rhizobium sp. L245/93]